jgi:hypothetical protein
LARSWRAAERRPSGGAINGGTISSGTLDVLSGATIGSAPINFESGGSGVLLILNDPTHFGGLVAGFFATSEIDLANFPYMSGATSATWSQIGSASGTLTVSEGGDIADLTLLGQYAEANFVPSAGPLGGDTLITFDPAGTAMTDMSTKVAVHPMDI